MSKISLERTKNKLVCPRCKEEKEDLDSLYRVVLEVYSVKGATNWKCTSEANTLEDFEYRVCGQCLDKIQEYIRDWKNYISKTKIRGLRPRNPRTRRTTLAQAVAETIPQVSTSRIDQERIR